MPSEPAPKPRSYAVTLDDAEIKRPVRAVTKLYELRVLTGAPMQTVNVPLYSTMRVATFTEYRGVPTMSIEGKIIGHVDYGNRQHLTESEVADVKNYVKSHVVMTQPGMKGVYATDDPVLRGQTPLSLAKFLGMSEIPESQVEAEKQNATSMAG